MWHRGLLDGMGISFLGIVIIVLLIAFLVVPTPTPDSQPDSPEEEK